MAEGGCHPSVVRDHDLAEMTATLETPVGLLGLSEPESPVYCGVQAMHSDGPVHGFEIGAAPDADRAESNAAAG
jgi:hypothetical protein